MELGVEGRAAGCAQGKRDRPRDDDGAMGRNDGGLDRVAVQGGAEGADATNVEDRLRVAGVIDDLQRPRPRLPLLKAGGTVGRRANGGDRLDQIDRQVRQIHVVHLVRDP